MLNRSLCVTTFGLLLDFAMEKIEVEKEVEVETEKEIDAEKQARSREVGS